MNEIPREEHPCDDHGSQLDLAAGEHHPCGICGWELYQAPMLIECSCCDEVFGVTIPCQWIGDAWVVLRRDRDLAGGAVLAHFRDAHPERLSA